MKFVKTIGILFTAVVLFTGCLLRQQSANPLQRYAGIGALDAAVKLDFKVPTGLPEGYIMTDCYLVNGEIVSLEYSDGDQTALYRTAKSTKELSESGISGDYQSYAFSFTEEICGNQVMFQSMSEQEDAPCLAQWTEEKMLFSLSGFTRKQAEEYILSLEKVSKVPDADRISRPEKEYSDGEEVAGWIALPVFANLAALDELPGVFSSAGTFRSVGSVMGIAQFQGEADRITVYASRGSAASEYYFEENMSASAVWQGYTVSMKGRENRWHTLSFSFESEGKQCSCQLRSESGVSMDFWETLFPMILEALVD